MPITGTFNADFKQFDEAVDQSTAKLRGLELQAAQVGPVVDTIGTKAPTAFEALITGADTAGTAIKGVGAEAETAEEWLARSLSTTKGLGSASTDLAGPLVTEAEALTHVGTGATASASALDLLGSAGLLVGAGMQGWQIGRAIADFFGLDEKIAHTTATLLGYGDVAAEISGAKQDTINRAIRDGADAHISYADAIKWTAAKVGEFNAILTRERAPEESAKQLAVWRGELQLVRDAGVLPGLTADVASHNFSIKDLATRYGISTDAIQLFARETKTASDSAAKDAKAAAVEIAAAQKEYGALLKEVQKLEADKNSASLTGLLGLSREEQKASQARFAEESKGLDAIDKAEAKLRDVQMKAALDTSTYQIMKIWERADAEIKAFKGGADKIKEFSDIVYTAANYEAQAITDAMGKAVDATAAKAQASLQAVLTAMAGTWAQYQAALDAANPNSVGTRVFDLGPGGSTGGTGRYLNGVDTWGVQTPKSRDAGGPVTAGQSYVVGTGAQPELFTPGANGFMTPHGGGVTNYITIQITQPLGTPDAIARALQDTARSRGIRL
jgi:hypothetical protein